MEVVAVSWSDPFKYRGRSRPTLPARFLSLVTNNMMKDTYRYWPGIGPINSRGILRSPSDAARMVGAGIR